VQNQFQEDEIPLALMAGRMKKFSENTPTIPEVMDSSTLNFKANFKFSRYFRVNNFYVCGPKYVKFFSTNVGGVVDL